MNKEQAGVARELGLRLLRDPETSEDNLEEKVRADQNFPNINSNTPEAETAREVIFGLLRYRFDWTCREIHAKYGGSRTWITKITRKAAKLIPEILRPRLPEPPNAEYMNMPDDEFSRWYLKLTNGVLSNHEMAARALAHRILYDPNVDSESLYKKVAVLARVTPEELLKSRKPHALIARTVLHYAYNTLFRWSCIEIQRKLGYASYTFVNTDIREMKGCMSADKRAHVPQRNMIIGVGDYKSPQWIREQIASVRKLGIQLPEGYEVVHAGAREYFLDLATIAKNSATEVIPLDHPLLAVLGQAFEDIISAVINEKSNASYLRTEFTDQTKYRQKVERDFLMLLGESDDPRQIQKALQQMVPPAEYQVYETALRILEIGCGVAGLRHMEQKLQDARRKYMAELILREGPSLVIVDARHAQPLEKLVSGYEARLL